MKLELPAYAWKYDHPANGPKDLAASLYEADGSGSITVQIQQDEGQFYLSFDRGGCSESRFSGPELAKVLEVAGCLAKALGVKQPI